MKKNFKPLIFTILLVIISSSLFFVTNISVADAVSSVEPIVVSATPSATDSAYDLRDYIDIQVENQGSYGICWAYASLTSLETYLALNYGEYYDFSELHLAISTYAQDGYYSSITNALKSGGNFDMLFTYAQKLNYFVLEEEYSISNYSSISNKMLTDYNTVNENYYSVAKIKDTHKFSSYYGDKSSKNLTQFRQEVKSHIIEYGSISSAIKTSGATWTASNDLCVTDSSVLTNPTQAVDHMISIIGWDDNYDANGEWSEKGAYLCLNSWGSSWGKNGCFYVSYNDYLVEYCMHGITSASLGDINLEYNTYKNYPTNTYSQRHTLGDGTLVTAQVLDVSPYLHQQLESIDFFIQGTQTSLSYKFYSTRSEAISGLNSSYSTLSTSSKQYSLYDKHTLSSPLTISNDYLVIFASTTILSSVRNISTSLASSSVDFEQDCFVQNSGGITWQAFLTSKNDDTTNYTLPIRLRFANPVEVSSFSGDAVSYTASTDTQYIKNNAIFLNKSLYCTIKNATIDLDNIKICKPIIANGGTDVTSKFTINLTGEKLSIVLSKAIDSTFTAGNYIISIPTSSGTIYRVIEVQTGITYLINYHLDGGVASDNPKYFTDKQTSLTLTDPVKDGYIFVAWYTDEGCTNEFVNTNLPKSSLDLYAKYDFACPTLVSKTSDVNSTYSKDSPVTIQVVARHALESQFNVISYQWYKKNGSTFEKLSGETNSSLSLNGVDKSGYYACEISITITDPSLVATSCVRTLEVSDKNAIQVTINKFIYNMSNAHWVYIDKDGKQSNYTEAVFYKASNYTMQVDGLPDGVTINYTGNSATDIGKYTAHAELVYDDMDGNAYAEPIEDLNWEIRKAKITIKIAEITEEEPLTLEQLKTKFDCTIDAEYLPAELSTNKQKLEYLEFEYLGPFDTDQPTIKTISGQTKQFDYYDITIIDSLYRQVTLTLTDTNNSGISVYNSHGFTKDCVFEVNYTTSVSAETQKLLSNAHVSLVKGYNLKFSYLRENDTYTVTLPIERNDLLAQLHIFMVKDGKLVRINQTDISTSGITIEAGELDAEFLIVEADTGHTSNTQKMAIILIACGFVILYVCIIVEHIRKKRRMW